MKQKIITKERTGSEDLLLSMNRDGGDEYDGKELVTLSFWVNDLYASRVVAFDDIESAERYIRDFSDVSAAEFIEQFGSNL